ncbi:TrbG/VirB9 family P-type conjugative transfer protein [Ralstonia sp. 121560039-2]|jgi:outer membrane protein OmpA-like peptidoglycan-associated protein
MLTLLNKVHFRLAILCFAGGVASGCATTPLPAVSNQNYDFAYQSVGGAGVRPSQVFDDGTKTYFQFPIGKVAPVIELDEAGGRRLLEPAQEGVYYTVPVVANRFVLQRGRETAVVEYDGGKPHLSGSVSPLAGRSVADSVAPQTLDPDALYAISQRGRPVHVKQSIQANSYATPVTGDNAAWATSLPTEDRFDVLFKRGSFTLIVPKKAAAAEILESARRAGRVVITGRDDDSMMETLAEKRAAAVKEWLVKNGVAPKIIRITADTTGAGGLDAQLQIYSKPPQTPVDYAPPDAVAFKADAIKSDMQAGAISREEGARRLAALVGYGVGGAEGPGGADLISMKTTMSVFAGKEGYRLTWSDGLGDSKITVPPIDRLSGIEAKAAELTKAGTGAFNLGVDKDAKALYAAADLNGLVQVAGKAGIETLSESNGTLAVKLRSTPKTMYVFDRADKSDLSVDWQDPTSFTVPMREKMELALDSKTLQVTRVADKRYVVVLQPSAETTTK